MADKRYKYSINKVGIITHLWGSPAALSPFVHCSSLVLTQLRPLWVLNTHFTFQEGTDRPPECSNFYQILHIDDGGRNIIFGLGVSLIFNAFSPSLS